MVLTQRFPNEITITILSFLPADDLARASRVSRDLQALAEPLLYRKPFLSCETAQPSDLHNFVRTLLTPGRQWLVSHIRTLVVDWDEYESSPPTTPENEVALFIAAGSRYGIRNPLASSAAQLFLCLHLLPSLTTLVLFPPLGYYIMVNFIESLKPTLPTSVPLGFQSLRNFHWYPGERHNEYGVSYTMLLTIICLPSIRTITVSIIERLCGPFPAADDMAISAITDLRLCCAAISSTTLTRILKLPRALTRFSFYAKNGNGSTIVHLTNELKPLQHSLQELVLDCLNCWDKGMEQSITKLASLRDWPELRIVRIAPVTLVGADNELGFAQVLPAGLCALGIEPDKFWSDEDVADMVLVMLEQKTRMLPRLQRLALSSGIGTKPVLLEKIMVACKSVGVMLVGNHELQG